MRKLAPSSLTSEKVTSCIRARGSSAPDRRQPANVTRVKEASSISAPEKSLPSTRTSVRRRWWRSEAVNDEWTMCESSTSRPARSRFEKSPCMVIRLIWEPAVMRSSDSVGKSGGRRGGVGRSLLRRAIPSRIGAAIQPPEPDLVGRQRGGPANSETDVEPYSCVPLFDGVVDEYDAARPEYP